MLQKNINDLLVFLSVAKERSFTKAAAKLGVSQSALSHTMRNLEGRLGIRLLMRTTRSVAPTEAGELLLKNIAPRVEEMEQELSRVIDFKQQPAGTIRLTADEHAANFMLWPRLRNFLRDYPDIKLEIDVDFALKDIVSEQYDAGVRLGELVHKDMIALSISPEIRMAVVASPAYLEKTNIPKKPKDLLKHQCINLRLPTAGNLYAWEFEVNKREVKVHVDGQLICNTLTQMLQAAFDGFGFAYVPEDEVNIALQQGRLVRVLEDFCPNIPGYYLYYPNRRQHSFAFSLFLKIFQQQNTK
ncbi:LysR family transcriptional regulator [Commensalibacter papalotli (ex Botero et al. 2024)]|nr:LysR family transcriptional regulator [Commensalibacter papalotli (ex Botero et al. 2024)]CAI3934614.1 DNA-binding transcriptional regulator [Commensalibacter papalotli (ex Botero et al. 2024)]CAI3941111.1 DNA-binding transcriptional regulator [Commensalibacter papalotli (ex Botero et al. 2024)]